MSNGRRRSGPNPRIPRAGNPTSPAGTVGGITVRPGLPSRPPLRPRGPKPIGNLFDAGRPGDPVVRAEDLLALRIERRNLTIQPGDAGKAPRLVKSSGRGAGYLILHFPPQAITEEAFYEQKPAGTKTQNELAEADTGGEYGDVSDEAPADEQISTSEEPREPPIRARAAGESRIVFRVPADFDIPYTLEGVLTACRELALRVPNNALPPPARRFAIHLDKLFQAGRLSKVSPAVRAALASFATRSAIVAGRGDEATLRLRHMAGGVAMKPLPRRARPVVPGIRRAKPPRPHRPSSVETAIELPWHLIVAPHAGERWRHADAPVHSSATGHTELWHSRLVAPDKDGNAVEPPAADSRRTLRAVWARSRDPHQNAANAPPMSDAHTFPGGGDIPDPDNYPFRAPLNDFDRYQFVHLSSNFTQSNYLPLPVQTNLLMLSALGGWLDSRGGWEPPGLSVEEWVHRASMARDHYVRVVYRGFLYPFGHRVSLVKVTERKFHQSGSRNNPLHGNPAYLRQRMFIVVREPVRRYDGPEYAGLGNTSGSRIYSHQFPFSSVRILTRVTPDIDPPETAPSRVVKRKRFFKWLQEVPGEYYGQLMFWPHTSTQPFRFQCVATDLDGRPVAFDLPMVFMDNTLACPRTSVNGSLQPDFGRGEFFARVARAEYTSRDALREVPMKRQRIALAPSLKSGDTSVQADSVVFSGEAEENNAALRSASDGLNRPLFFPKVDSLRAQIAPLAHLTQSAAGNKLEWDPVYQQHGFGTSANPTVNAGQVFISVVEESGMAQLDFSSQGDRSGGFVQPNLMPRALSRIAGPVMSDVAQFRLGQMPGGSGFPASGDSPIPALEDLPLPLIFGCIPLGDIISLVADIGEAPAKVPKFVSEAGTALEDFINALGRAYGLVAGLHAQAGSLAEGTVQSFVATGTDLASQAQALPAAQIAAVQSALAQVESVIVQVRTAAGAIAGLPFDDPAKAAALAALSTAAAGARPAVAALITTANASVGGVSLPAGLRQSLLSLGQQLDDTLADLEQFESVVNAATALYDALHAVIGNAGQLPALLEDAAALTALLELVKTRVDQLGAALGDFRLLDGTPRAVLLNALGAIGEVLGTVTNIVEMLTGDELTIRFDWNPEIKHWTLSGGTDDASRDDVIFRANDRKGFLVAVEAKVKKNGQSAPKISVVCGLKQFDLVLIAPASFLELNFEKIEFSVDSAAKMDVDVLLTDIKFVGPLSFVETLRDLIPLDGFSDPPYLDITAQGIDAGFNVALPGISVGVMSLNNLSLGAGFTVPFIGQPLSVRFNFCTREQPFTLTVYMFGGGGFLGVTLDPHGVQILEASFEFGASLSIDFGVASGGVHVMAGIYYRMEADAASLTGYFRLGGHVDVLGLISASIELYLELCYEFESGKCTGKAELTIEISVFVFSGSVTITCERKFAGSNGDPTFRDMMGPDPSLSLTDELATIDETSRYPWREYCEAFA